MSAAAWGRPAPVRLAPGEHLIWQGAPAWPAIAVRVCHVRPVAIYFVALMLADMAQTRLAGMGGLAALRAAIPGALTGAGALLILLALAWGVARTTRYSITSRRVVMQFGLALPATLVLPLHRIAAASVRVRRDHTGDIALRLHAGNGSKTIGYAKLWPHARPWRLSTAEPMLRDVARAAMVAAPLSRALAAADTARQAQVLRLAS